MEILILIAVVAAAVMAYKETREIEKMVVNIGKEKGLYDE